LGAEVLFTAVVCCVAFPLRARGQAQLGSKAPTTAPAQSQPQSLPPAPRDLDALITHFGEELHSAGTKRVVITSGLLPGSRQNALQDWLVSRVGAVLAREPKWFALFHDKPGGGLDLREVDLDAVRIDTIVSASLYPNRDGIHVTLNAEPVKADWTENKSKALVSADVPLTDEMAALLPPEWKKQIEEEQAAPKAPFANDANTSKLPTCLSCKDPHFSDLAKQLKVVGTVVVMVTVELDGTAHNIQLVKGLGYGLDEAAIEAVSRWKFEPALDKMGNPIAATVEIEVRFRLL